MYHNTLQNFKKECRYLRPAASLNPYLRLQPIRLYCYKALQVILTCSEGYEALFYISGPGPTVTLCTILIFFLQQVPTLKQLLCVLLFLWRPLPSFEQDVTFEVTSRDSVLIVSKDVSQAWCDAPVLLVTVEAEAGQWLEAGIGNQPG